MLATGIAVVRARPSSNDVADIGGRAETVAEMNALLQQHQEAQRETTEAIPSRQQRATLPSFLGNDNEHTVGTMC